MFFANFISAGAIIAVALFLRFALVGYSFLAYCLICAAAVVLIYGFLIWKKLKTLIIILTILLILGFALFLIMEIPVIIDSFVDKDVDKEEDVELNTALDPFVILVAVCAFSLRRMSPGSR